MVMLHGRKKRTAMQHRRRQGTADRITTAERIQRLNKRALGKHAEKDLVLETTAAYWNGADLAGPFVSLLQLSCTTDIVSTRGRHR